MPIGVLKSRAIALRNGREWLDVKVEPVHRLADARFAAGDNAMVIGSSKPVTMRWSLAAVEGAAGVGAIGAVGAGAAGAGTADGIIGMGDTAGAGVGVGDSVGTGAVSRVQAQAQEVERVHVYGQRVSWVRTQAWKVERARRAVQSEGAAE